MKKKNRHTANVEIERYLKTTKMPTPTTRARNAVAPADRKSKTNTWNEGKY